MTDSPAIEFLSRLRALEVRVWAEGDRLRCSAPRNILTDELRAELSQRKGELLALLRGNPSQMGGAAADDTPAATPLSFSQQRLWFLDRLRPNSSEYNLCGASRLTGRLNCEALERAIGVIVDRHEVLRARFPMVDGNPAQIIAPPHEFRITMRDVCHLPRADRDAHARRLVLADAARPFDLAGESLFRATLYRLDDDEHLLSCVMHHIIADGWSAWVFIQELCALYSAFTAGSPSHLQPLPTQYAQFARWQRERLQGEFLERELSYWVRQLHGRSDTLGLPTDRPRPTMQTANGALEVVPLPAGLMEAVEQLSRREGVTPFMTLLAAFTTLLFRYSGQDDITIGTPIANRTRLEFERLIGFFANTLVLRTDLSGNPTFRELLQRVRTTALDAYAHQDVPFEKLVEVLQPAREMSRSPLFQVMFALQNFPHQQLELPGVTLEPVELHTGAAQAEIMLHVARDPHDADRVRFVFEYNTDLFDGGTIRAMAGHLAAFLEQVVRDPTQRLLDIPILGDDERRRMLVEWNATERPYALDTTLAALVEAQVDRTPDTVAVQCDEQTLTYAELDARANQLAHAMRASGVGAETLVGVCMERSLEMVVALLGILKAGGAYVPLDPTYPAERLAFMVQDAAVPLLLTQAHLRDALPRTHAMVVALDADWATIARQPATRPTPAASQDDLAYMIYTSGSTGRPKGALNTHRAIVNRLLWMQETFGLDASDRVLQKTPFSFDVSVWEFFWPLMTGARLVMARPAGHKDAEYLIDAIAREGITTVHFVPSMLQVFLGQPELAGCASLRRVIASGEILPLELVRRFHARLGAELHNLYGPTECAVDVTWWPCARGAERVPIGRPIANTQLYVLDTQGRPTPIGVPGELHIGGVQVGRGYHGRAKLTADKFIADPFSARRGARLYRTGDRARWLADGTLDYLGRLDEQVKLRGFRIELGEIEAALVRFPGVREAAAAIHGAAGDQRLVGYYTGDVARDVDALRAHLGASLPDYMVPAAYVHLDALPLSPSGKLDRKALPAPDGAAFGAGAYEAPAGEVETRVAEIWNSVLPVERVGRHDNFFTLGGHSLLAVTLVEKLRQAGFSTDVRTLFLAPTVAALAARLLAGEGAARARRVVVPPNGIPAGCTAITPGMLPLISLEQSEIDAIARAVPGGAANVQDIYPLAPLQEGILFHHVMATAGDPYILSALIAVDGRERLDAYLDALRAVIARHDVLRTAIQWEGLQQPVQVVWRTADLVVEHVELEPTNGGGSGGSNGDAAAQLLAMRDPRRTRLDLRTAPLLRAWTAEEVPGRRWLVLILFHHVVTDHTTLELVQAEVSELLLARRDGRTPLLAQPRPFREFVGEARLGVSDAEHDAFFSGMLRDVDEPTAPFGLVDVKADGATVAEARAALDPELARRLRALARQFGVSVASLCHLAWAQVCARTTGRDDVVFGTVLFGRMQGAAGIDTAFGIFINTLPLRLSVGATTVERAVREAHARLVELLRHEHASLARAQRTSGVAPPAPLFTSLLNYRYAGGADRDKAESARDAFEGFSLIRGEERSNYPIMLAVDDLGDGLALDAQTQPGLAPERVCAFMLAALRGIADALEHEPSRALHTVDVLPASERASLLAVNATDVSLTAACVHDLVMDTARATPERVAVVCESARLTYGELARRAGALGVTLRASGARPGAFVGICVDRSTDMLVALLATLDAGAAYVPLDPAYPAARLSMMLEDAACTVLVAQERTRAAVVGFRGEILLLDGAASSGAAGRGPRAAPDDLAYAIFTSGSTGRPKGVEIRHASLVNVLTSMARTVAFGPDDVLLAVTTLSFDIAGLELWLPLTRGGRVVLATRAQALDPVALAATIEREGVTVMQATPATWRMLVDNGWRPPPGLRMLCGGEALPYDLAQTLLSTGARLWNVYGPTETTIWSTVHEVRPGESPIPIGQPIDNTRVYVLDAHARRAPVGVRGELFIGGAGVARGYVGRPDLTAERFLADPFAGCAARMYRTGDHASIRADGVLDYFGRGDDQVKIRGFRVELGEIETVLATHPRVRQAVVAARADGGTHRLAAYVIPHGGDAPAASDLRAYVAARLPDYMVPSSFTSLAAFPRTPNGKVDRRRLPAPGALTAPAAQRSTSPRTKIEGAIARVWSEVLGVPDVSVTDNFFDLGGHSLLLVKAHSALRATLDDELSIIEMFEHPTVRALARLLEGRAAAANRP